MKIEIIAVGKMDSAFYRGMQDDYLQRLQRYLEVKIVEVKEPGGRYCNSAEVIKRYTSEVEKILNGRRFILTDINAEQYSSRRFSANLERILETPPNEALLVIGGSFGFLKQFKTKAAQTVSFSKMTFPHQLFRVMLLEQLYRSMTLIRGEKYHK